MLSGFKLIGLNILSDAMTKFVGVHFHPPTVFSSQVLVASIWSLSIWCKLGYPYYFSHIVCVILSIIQIFWTLAKKPLNEFWIGFSILVFALWIISLVYETYPNLIADVKFFFKHVSDALTNGADADVVKICENAAAEIGDGAGGDLELAEAFG